MTRVDGHPVQSARDFFEILVTTLDGQELHLEIWRDGKTRKIALRPRRFRSAGRTRW